tara:strand:- start:153 stop:419 length:267 start_codon:yes stop_codon:yes gene_type:complete
MPKYTMNENILGDFVSSIFRAIGRGGGSRVINKLAAKDPKFAKLQKDLEKSRDELDTYLKNKVRTKPKAKLSRADIKAINRGDLPDWL